jgi:hypothetical protein
MGDLAQLDGQRRRVGEGRQRRVEPRLGQDRGKDPVRELAELRRNVPRSADPIEPRRELTVGAGTGEPDLERDR